MDTSRDYYEDKIADFNRYRRGRNLYQFCKDEGIDYNWMLRAQRQFGGKGPGKRNSGHEKATEPDMIQLHFEDDAQPQEPEAVTAFVGEPKRSMAEAQERWKVSDVLITDPDGNEITLRCASVGALGRILTRLADRHD